MSLRMKRTAPRSPTINPTGNARHTPDCTEDDKCPCMKDLYRMNPMIRPITRWPRMSIYQYYHGSGIKRVWLLAT